jgi:hypothetical protein
LAEAMREGLEMRLLTGPSGTDAPVSWQPALTKRTLIGRVALFVGPPVERVLSRLCGVVLGPWLTRQRDMHRQLVQEIRTLNDEVAALREEVAKAVRSRAHEKAASAEAGN